MTWAANTYTLVADIGGTNSRVALARGTEVLTETVQRYTNAKFSGFDEVLQAYLAAHDDVDCIGACAALAGPVKDGVGTLTNLDWKIDEALLARTAKAKNVGVFNDLQAQGYALGNLADGSVTRLFGAPAMQDAAIKLVIGIGTGFNAALVIDTPDGRIVPPAEAGHTTLPARTDTEIAFARNREEMVGFAAVEDMLSGRGLERLYAFLNDGNSATGHEILAAFESDSDPVANQTTQMFVTMLGAVAGNLALVHLPFGGIYFAGGVARAFSSHFETLEFGKAFRDKGRFADFMDQFAVHMIEDDYAALTGCAAYLASL
jgi:glucokinase